MKLNIFLRFSLLLGCGLVISCENVERNFEQLDNPSHKVLEKKKHPKELDYLEENSNERYPGVNDRSFKILKNFHSGKDHSNLNYKSSAGPNNIREMKILKKIDSFHENKNENFAPKTLLEPELEGKEYKNVRSSKNFNKNPPANRIRRELPQMFGYTRSTATKKPMSSAEKFLKLDVKERERLLEKVFNEINRKLNRPEFGKGCIDDNESVEVKPQLLILNSKSKPKREKNIETKRSDSKAVENPYSSKTYEEIPSDSFNDKPVVLPDLKADSEISSIGKQTGRNNINTEQFATNSKNFSKREDTQYQTDGIHLTTLMPDASEQKLSVKEPVETGRVEENKSEIYNKDEIISDQSDNIQSKDTLSSQSEKLVKERNKNRQPQLYQILKNPFETNKFGQSEGSSDSSKMSERMNNNQGEDDELLEYIKNNVKNCLQEMRKDIKEEEKEKSEMRERNHGTETPSDTKENYPKEISPELIKQLNLFDKLNSLNPNSPGFQLLWNMLQSTPSEPNILLGDNQKRHAKNVGPYRSPLVDDNYLNEASSEENGNDSYDVILQMDLKNLDDFAQFYIKPNMGATSFDRFWGADFLDELFL